MTPLVCTLFWWLSLLFLSRFLVGICDLSLTKDGCLLGAGESVEYCGSIRWTSSASSGALLLVAESTARRVSVSEFIRRGGTRQEDMSKKEEKC